MAFLFQIPVPNSFHKTLYPSRQLQRRGDFYYARDSVSILPLQLQYFVVIFRDFRGHVYSDSPDP